MKLGYIEGSEDGVPQAIEQIGLSVTIFDENYLSSGDLSKFDNYCCLNLCLVNWFRFCGE